MAYLLVPKLNSTHPNSTCTEDGVGFSADAKKTRARSNILCYGMLHFSLSLFYSTLSKSFKHFL